MKILRSALIVLTAGYWALLATLTHVPRLPPTGPRLNDKLAHFAAYALLSACLYLTLRVARPGRRHVAAWVLLVGLTYAGIDELTQPLTGRDCDPADWAANVAGVLAATALLVTLQAVLRRHRPIASDNSPS